MSNARTVSVVCYSQSGQTRKAAETLVAPLASAGREVQWVDIEPVPAHPFPWTTPQLLDAFPQCRGKDAEVEITRSARIEGDLVILATPVWFLSPAPAMQSLLRSAEDELAGKDVVGLLVCCSTWYSAAVEMQGLATAAGARYRGTIAAAEPHPVPVSFVTHLRALLTGGRGRLGPLPKAGITSGELARLRGVGRALADWDADDLGAVLAGSYAAPFVQTLAGVDLLADRVFALLARVIRNATRPGTPARRRALWSVAATFIGGITLGIPATALVRLVVGNRLDTAVMNRLAPALYGTPPGATASGGRAEAAPVPGTE